MNEPFVLTTCTIGIGVLIWLWFVPIAALRRDNYRADIRRLRDGLFDFMWKNGYSFDTPAYVETRQVLNGLLRWSNFVSPIKFFMTAYFASNAKDDADSLANNLRDCASPLKERIEQTLHGATRRTLKFIFREGSTGVFVSLLLLVFKVFGRFTRIKKEIIKRSDALIKEAYFLGGPELSREQRALLG